MSRSDLPEVVYLNGVRFVRASEALPGEEDQEALIRTLTRGAPSEVRRCCDDGVWRDVKAAPFEFKPSSEGREE